MPIVKYFLLDWHIQDIPDTDDPRVQEVWVWASADGRNETYQLVGKVPIHTKIFQDVTPQNIYDSGKYLDPALGLFRNSVTAPKYTYQKLPSPNAGPLIVRLKKNGVHWCDFFIPRDIDGQEQSQNASNIIHGFALDPVSQDVVITADIENSLEGSIDIFIELE